jgi:hypothetical protein
MNNSVTGIWDNSVPPRLNSRFQAANRSSQALSEELDAAWLKILSGCVCVV